MGKWIVATVVAALILGAASAGATSVEGGTSAQRQLATRILQRLAPSKLVSVRFRVGDEMRIHGVDGSVRATWEEKLFGVSFVLAAKRLGVREPRTISTDEESGPAEDADNTRPAPSALRRYVAALRFAATRSRVRVIDLRVLRPQVTAVAVTLRVDDPAAFLKHRSRQLVRLIDSAPAGVYGRYIGLQDRAGKIVWALSRLPNEGGYYVRPDLYSCSPIATFAPPPHPPPCPA